jgi:hypothetical protein
MVYLAFKIARSFTEKLIAAHDPPKRYCHVELAFVSPTLGLRNATIFSATTRDGARFAHEVDLSGDQWDVVYLALAYEQEERLRAWCAAMEKRDTKYDFAGVVAFKLPWRRQDPDRVFCSEVCSAGLLEVGYLPPEVTNPGVTSPNLLYLMARMKQWGEGGWKL